ncbi:MAG: sulfatase-like hydrolase/transferase [Pirellulales bacterium]|nr:sulfatase-like hydrolase/transferase [Pirellulales bacterium]
MPGILNWRTLFVVAFVLNPVLGGAAESTARPHIIFVLADDLGPGDLGCYGGTIAPTPNIDQLAADGIRFEQYYAASPICSPSRCGLITGQFPARWRITSYLQTRAGNRGCEQADYLDASAPSLPRALQASGYKTAHFGKWHLGGGRDVENAPRFAAYGYDASAGTWESPEPHPDITASDWIWSNEDKVKRWERTGFFVDLTLDFLRRHKSSPCFVNLWLDDTHTPWTPDADADPHRETRSNLQGVIREMDRQIGRLRRGLRELGVEEETLLIFASDNGPLPTFKEARTRGLRGSKLSLYEGGLRLPFIACWPDNTPAGREDATSVIAAVDMFPTFCRIAEAAPPPHYASDGEDVSAALFGQAINTRSRPVYWEYGRNDEFFAYPKKPRDRSPNVAIRSGPWKLLINADGTNAELYNLSTDREEVHNLAAQQPSVVEELTDQALDWRKSLP